MVELYGVDNADRLGDGIYNFVTAVVVDGRANAEPVLCAEVPGIARSRFVVDGDFSSDGAERCGIVIYGTVVVFSL